jgi:putative peptidoglycan lipid II flippase
VLWLASAPVAALFASRASLRDQSTLGLLAVIGGVVYAGLVLVLFGKEWLATFRRRRRTAQK